MEQKVKRLKAATAPEHGGLVDIRRLASMVGVSTVTLLTWRSRSPWLLPPPINRKPLRWRVATVEAWLNKREAVEVERCLQLSRSQSRDVMSGWVDTDPDARPKSPTA